MLISFVGFFDAQINVDCDDEDEETSAGSDEGSAKGGSFSGSGKLKRPASEEQSRSTRSLFPLLSRNTLSLSPRLEWQHAVSFSSSCALAAEARRRAQWARSSSCTGACCRSIGRVEAVHWHWAVYYWETGQILSHPQSLGNDRRLSISAWAVKISASSCCNVMDASNSTEGLVHERSQTT